MARPSFVNCLFSWLSNFNLEFRTPCNICGYEPKVLACYGTKIGLFFRNLTVTPIEKEDLNEEVQPLSHRTDWHFFACSAKASPSVKAAKHTAMEHLKRAAQYHLSRDMSVVQNFDSGAIIPGVHPELQPLFQSYFSCKLPVTVHSALSHLMLMLADKCPTSSILNPRFVDLFEALLAGSCDTTISHELPKLGNLDFQSQTTGYLDKVRPLFNYIVEAVILNILRIYRTQNLSLLRLTTLK